MTRNSDPNGLTRLSDRTGHALATAFPSGVLTVDGAPYGMWLTASPSASDAAGTAWVAWRSGGRARVAEFPVPAGSCADGDMAAAAAAGEIPSTQPFVLFGRLVLTLDHVLGGRHAEVETATLSTTMLAHVGRVMPPTLSVTEVRAVSHRAAQVALDVVAARVAPFVATLDRRAVERARRSRGNQALMQAWDGFDRSFNPDVPLVETVVAHPLLEGCVWRAWTRAPGAFRDARTVEGTLATVGRHLADEGRIPRMASDALAAATEGWHMARAEVTGDGVPGDVVGAMTPLASLPHDWTPGDDAAAWRAWFKASTVATSARSALAPRPGPLDVLLNSGGRWEEWVRRIEAAAACPRRKVGAAVRGTRDVASAFADQVLLPACAVVDAPPPDRDAAILAASRALHSGRSLGRVLETSRRWHAAIDASTAGIAVLPGHEGTRRRDPPWPAVLPDHADGDAVIRVLTCGRELVAEGMAMSHCVGTYAPACRSGTIRVASVRRGGARSSTVAFHLAGRPKVSQHLSHGNGPPPVTDVALVARYLGALPHVSPVDGTDDEVDDALPTARGPRPFDYDPAFPGNWEAVEALWRPFLPRRLRGLAAADWAAWTMATAADRAGWRPEPVTDGDVRAARR